jgi:3-deoxy-D-manno-octulosonic-acid transferase
VILTALYKIVYPTLWLLAMALQRFFPKVQKGFQLRAAQNGIKPWLNYTKYTQPIWIHAPSGEFEYALPVIRELKSKYPNTKILVTYYTPSYIERIAKEPLVDFFCPLPWDCARSLKEFITHHQPQQLWIARTGFWPELLKQCAHARVPVSVFSMTFNKQLSFLGRWYYSWLLKHITQFFVVADDDRLCLQEVLPNATITILGDTRYDQCVYRLQQNVPLKIARNKLPRKVFVCASTWPEDEAVLLPYIKSQIQNAHWIVVPHEINAQHISAIRKSLHPVPVALYSQIETWNGDGVLIVDVFGVLASIYKVTDGAFIGGSFKARVHSVMESLACGNITFVGPMHTTNREALEFLKLTATQTPPVVVLHSAKDTPLVLQRLNEWSAADSQTLQQEFTKKLGVSQILVQTLLK